MDDGIGLFTIGVIQGHVTPRETETECEKGQRAQKSGRAYHLGLVWRTCVCDIGSILLRPLAVRPGRVSSLQ